MFHVVNGVCYLVRIAGFVGVPVVVWLSVVKRRPVNDVSLNKVARWRVDVQNVGVHQ